MLNLICSNNDEEKDAKQEAGIVVVVDDKADSVPAPPELDMAQLEMAQLQGEEKQDADEPLLALTKREFKKLVNESIEEFAEPPSEAPESFHQATVFIVLKDPEASPQAKRRALMTSWGLVLLQAAGTAAILLSYTSPMCSNSTQNPKSCNSGFFCADFEPGCVSVQIGPIIPVDDCRTMHEGPAIGRAVTVGVCMSCDSTIPFRTPCGDGKKKCPPSGPDLCVEYYSNSSYFETIQADPEFPFAEKYQRYSFGRLVRPSTEDWAHYDDEYKFGFRKSESVDRWKRECDQCQSPNRVSFLSLRRVTLDKFYRARLLDVLTVVLCIGLATLCLSGEIHAIRLAHIMIEQYAPAAATTMRSTLAGLPPPCCIFWCLEYRTSLNWLLYVRTFVSIVLLTCSIPYIAVSTDGSAAAIAGNTVGFLFLLELDSGIWALGMSKPTRSRISEEGKFFLTEDKSARIDKSKKIMIAVLIGAQITAVMAMLLSGETSTPCHITVLVSIWIAGIIDHVLVDQPPLREVVKRNVRTLLVALFLIPFFFLVLGTLYLPPIGLAPSSLMTPQK